MPEPKILTGHTVAAVRLAEGGEVYVRRGEALPEGMADGEEARLDRLGGFAAPPEADLGLQGARRAVIAAPEVARHDPALPGRGDFGAPLLSPQVTLAANPDPEGEPSFAQAVADDLSVPLVTAGELGEEPSAVPVSGTAKKPSTRAR